MDPWSTHEVEWFQIELNDFNNAHEIGWSKGPRELTSIHFHVSFHVDSSIMYLD